MNYCDNAATTRPYPEVVERVMHCLTDAFANPSSSHPAGMKARRLIEESREKLAGLFGVASAGIVFCSSGTESDNLAIQGTLSRHRPDASSIILSRLEHPAVTEAVRKMEKNGFRVDWLDTRPDTGRVDSEHLNSLMTPNTKLVSIQHVNSETGVVQDLSTLSKIIKQKNPTTLFHSDGVQAFTKIDFDFSSLGVDLYTISGHKFHGIKGAGALILRGKTAMEPMIRGGGQESGLRSGTENVAAIVAMATAAEVATKNTAVDDRLLTDFAAVFKSTLRKRIPSIRLFSSAFCLPHIISLSVPGIPGEVLANHLGTRGVFVSTGSACSTTHKHLSPSLLAVGHTPERIRETIRFSMAATEIPPDPDRFCADFIAVIEELRSVV
jgi:cysteine desulfurase